MAVTSIGATVPTETAYGRIVNTSGVEEQAPKLRTNTEQIVRSYFEDIPVMIQIARCESTFRHTLEDGSVLKGVVDPADTGVMQINKRYHEKTAATMNLDLNDIQENMAYARHLYETQGTQPWSASSSCWGQTLAMNI